jgi:glycosyltransferase involved in cell wall biosynthesis
MKMHLYELKTDVVHAHWTYEFALAAIKSRHSRVLVTAHDAPITVVRKSPSAYRLLRLIVAMRARLGIARLTAVSPYLADRWRREMFYTRNVEVIPNPLPHLNLPKERSRRSGPPVIMDIADGSALKNVRTLIKAFGRVRASIPDATLRLIGPGLAEDDELAVWVRRSGQHSGVRFLGRQGRDDVARHLSEASVFCHSAVEESQPMCLLEAMAAGVPVVAGRDAGGVPWTLGYGAAGALVDVTDERSLAQGVTSMIENHRVASQYVDVGRELLKERHTPERVAELYIREYGRMLAGEEIRVVNESMASD